MLAGRVRVSQFWGQVKLRLSSVRMIAVLGGTDRVYIDTENYDEPEGPEAGQWGRLVIVPVVTLWNPREIPGESRRVAFLVRTEFNNFDSPTYNVMVPLEAAQDEAYVLLNNWILPLNAMTQVKMATPVYRFAFPQAMPLFDNTRNVWYLSSEYRTELTAT